MTNKCAMKTVKETVKMLLQGRSHSEIGRDLNISRSLVAKWRKRITDYEPDLGKASRLDEEQLRAIIYPPTAQRCYEPDWDDFFEKMKIKSLTADAYYRRVYLPSVPATETALKPSSFYQSVIRERQRRGLIDLNCVKPEFEPGEVMEIDYAGGRYSYHNKVGKLCYCRLFVATLPYSRMLYAYATGHARRADWIEGIISAFEYFGGTPQFIVMDNDTALVDRTKEKWDPTINPALEDLAVHYNLKLHACRVREPRDKQAVEAAACEAQRFYASMRLIEPMCFADLKDFNAVLQRYVEEFNNRPFKRYPDSTRRKEFEAEKACLKPLPQTPYIACAWKVRRVSKQHHFYLEGHNYSVPVTLTGKDVQLRITPDDITVYDAETLEFIYRHHRHTNAVGQKTHTEECHLTECEKALRINPEQCIRKIAAHGVDSSLAARFVHRLFEANKMNARGQCMGIIKMLKKEPAIVQQQMRFLIEIEEISYRELKRRVQEQIRQRDILERQSKLNLPECCSNNPNYITPPHGGIRGNYM